MKFNNVLFLYFVFFTTILNAQVDSTKISPETVGSISMSIRPGSEAGALNIRSQFCPSENFDFRTCEGVISGSTDVGGLFKVKLPPAFGDGNKSWKQENDIWSYTWPYPEGITVNVAAQLVADGLKLVYTLKNTSSNALDTVQLHTCIPTTEAPGFFPEPTVRNGEKIWAELYERLFLWSDGRRFSFAEARLADSESHLAFVYRTAAPVHWGWWVNGSETFNLPLIALTSRDRRHTVALAFNQAIWASSNVGDERACFHLFPWFGRIEPGKSVTVEGRLYILEGGPQAAFDRFQKDFPEITSASLSIGRIGPSTAYSLDANRYRFDELNVANTEFYPIPQDKVTRATYMRWLEESGLIDYAKKPAMGMSGPQNFMPVLAKYVQTKDRALGESIITMLKDYHRALQEEVASKGWFWEFIEEAAFVPLYRKYLIEGGLMKADEPWFQELWLYYCRNLHVWSTAPIEWRGGCHRSMPEALSKGLAAKWYPDIPEAAHWKRYSELVFNDFWKSKDFPQNDTHYFHMTIYMLICCGDQYLDDDRAITDPGMQKLWGRLLMEITPDGAINPYGPNGGWNSTAALRIFILELAAAKTHRPEYRYAAHKAMNYIRYQTSSYNKDIYLTNRETGQNIALAWLATDDSLEPKMPSSGSVMSERIEALRISPADKKTAGRYWQNIDPEPNRGHICCGWVMGDKTVPDKLALRSGWNAGDFFALVELCPVSFPFNPGGIMGLNRWGSTFTQISCSKGHSVENRLLLEDLSGQAPRRYLPDINLYNEDWQKGVMEAQTSSVPLFQDKTNTTFAKVVVGNFLGLPVQYEREFVFIKNGCLVSRETVIFEEPFPARVGPTWNTQNIGPQAGSNWANTFMSAPIASNGHVTMRTPPADLLVWFAPRSDCLLKVVDRREDDPRTEVAPYQLRYEWEGRPLKGQKLTWTEVFWPHQPWKPRPSTSNPGAKPVYDAGEIAATAGASAIEVLRDTIGVTVLRLHFETGKIRWIVFNPGNTVVEIEGLVTDAQFAVIIQLDDKSATAEAVGANRLSLGGIDLLNACPLKTK
jgi:hypothetical protein